MQAANSYATGGGGPDFERRVATGFICSALVGVQIPPLAEPVSTLSLQAAHLNCGFDDIVLETVGSNKTQQRVFVSVKSAIIPTTSDSEFSDVISKAWIDWQAGTCFDRSKDKFLLAAATSRSPRIHLLGKLTDIAKASSDNMDFERRLSLEGYNRAEIRKLRPDISAIIERETQKRPDGEDIRQLLRCLFVMTFDFDQEASQDKARIIGMLTLASESRDRSAADSCWNGVFERTSLGTTKAKVLTSDDFATIGREYGLRVDPSNRIKTWLSNLRAHSRINRRGITSALFGNQRHVLRQGLLEDLREAFSGSQFILVTGAAGTGKSALAVEIAEEYAKPDNVFCFQSEELACPHLDAALQASGLRGLNAEEWADALPMEPRILLIDALERLLQSNTSKQALSQLLQTVADDRRWKVVVTCREYLADHVRDSWNVPTGWAVVQVPLLGPAEFEQAVSGTSIPEMWLKQPAVRDALRNLKWLDLTLRAAQRIKDIVPNSAWATLANWRSFVWQQLLQPEVDSRGQELLIRIGIERATSGSSWATVDNASLPVAEQLRKQGLLSKHDLFPDRYRPEHDLLEDWALLFYVRREFTEYSYRPAELFSRLGDRPIVRRAFRQFFGELLESDQRDKGVSFIRQVLDGNSFGREWREEIVNSLLGSSCAKEIFDQTQDFWTEASGEGLRTLCHMLRIAYLAKPAEEGEPERPFGPGWNAVMTFIHAQGDRFIRHHTRAVTILLLDWRHAVTPECPFPPGLPAAADLVRGLWQIATAGEERFEKYWGNDKWHHTSPSANCLCWLVAAVAGPLGPEFFREVERDVFGNQEHNILSTGREKHRQSRELVEFLVSDHAGWPLARVGLPRKNGQ